jgi:hypothetical protein
MGPTSLVASAMGSAVALGLAIVGSTVLGVDLVRPASLPANPELGPALSLLFFGTLAGLLGAGVVAWHLLSPILSIYHRGGLSVVSAFATVVAMLLCIPVHQLAGRAGLGVLIAAALLVSRLLARRARRFAAVA